jgi:hypothetical protein
LEFRAVYPNSIGDAALLHAGKPAHLPLVKRQKKLFRYRRASEADPGDLAMRNNVMEPAKQFIIRHGDRAYAKAREAQLAARKERKGQLAAFYGKVAEKIEEVSVHFPLAT